MSLARSGGSRLQEFHYLALIHGRHHRIETLTTIYIRSGRTSVKIHSDQFEENRHVLPGIVRRSGSSPADGKPWLHVVVDIRVDHGRGPPGKEVAEEQAGLDLAPEQQQPVAVRPVVDQQKLVLCR